MSAGAAENGCSFATEDPLLHTVEEAAGVLRIGRTLAYDLARRYEASGGVAGIPVIRLGSCLRVPRWALLELARTGRVVALCEVVADVAELLSGPDASTLVDRSGELDRRSDVQLIEASQPNRQKHSVSGEAAARHLGQQLFLLPSE